MRKELEAFWPAISEAAQRHGLEPALVGAVVMAESAGDPNAVRYEPHAGFYLQDPHQHRPRSCSVETEQRLQMFSWGLMQVMGFNLRAMGFSGWLTEFVQPGPALEAGCRFLAGLFERWPRIEDAVSAYNQGGPRQDRQGRYLNQPYVDKVMAYYQELETACAPDAGRTEGEEK